MKTVTQEDIRAIHSRLDVHKDVLEDLLTAIVHQDSPFVYIYLMEKLSESQNPFNLTTQPHE